MTTPFAKRSHRELRLVDDKGSRLRAKLRFLEQQERRLTMALALRHTSARRRRIILERLETLGLAIGQVRGLLARLH